MSLRPIQALFRGFRCSFHQPEWHIEASGTSSLAPLKSAVVVSCGALHCLLQNFDGCESYLRFPTMRAPLWARARLRGSRAIFFFAIIGAVASVNPILLTPDSQQRLHEQRQAQRVQHDNSRVAEGASGRCVWLCSGCWMQQLIKASLLRSWTVTPGSQPGTPSLGAPGSSSPARAGAAPQCCRGRCSSGRLWRST